MSYTKTPWVNDSLPAINANNLNNIESGIETNDTRTSYGNTVGGTANAITITTTGGNFTFSVGESVKGIATANNTGAVTVNVDGDGVTTVKKLDGSSYVACEADDFEDNKPFELIGQNDGADFFLLAPKGGANIKSVQRGSTTVTATTTNVTITSVDLTKSIVKISFRCASDSVADRSFVTAALTSSTNLRLQVDATPTGVTPLVQWEVVEFNNVKSKQSGNLSFTASTEQSISITSIDTSKSIIFASFRQTAAATGTGYGCNSFRIIDSTNIGVQRTNAIAGTTVTEWQVIGFK